MRNIHCNVIQDLLPLYADDVVSRESRELVQEHLACCPECRQVLAEIRAEIPVPRDTDDSALKKIRKKQRTRIICAALAAVLCAFGLMFCFLSAIYESSIEAQSAVYGPECFVVTESPDGRVELTLTEEAQGAYVYYLYEINEDDSTDLYLYIYGRDPVPPLLGRLVNLRFFWGDEYPVRGIGPRYQFEADDYRTSYTSIGGLTLDETISNVYYQTITAQEQWDFYNRYLTTGYLSGYDAPERSDCTLIWSRGD